MRLKSSATLLRIAQSEQAAAADLTPEDDQRICRGHRMRRIRRERPSGAAEFEAEAEEKKKVAAMARLSWGLAECVPEPQKASCA